MRKVAVICVIFISLISCKNINDEVYMNNVNGQWDKKEIQNFDFTINESQNPKNIIFVVRNNNDYPYSNLRLIVSLLDKKTQKKSIDTLNYVLAKPNGEWLGKGFGDTKETLFQYKLNHQFPHNGTYSIGIIQAMRADQLKGIEDIGVKIETAKP